MGLFGFLKHKEEPINIDDQSNHELIACLNAHYQALEAESRGSVAAKHLHQIAIRHATISRNLDAVLETYETAVTSATGNGSNDDYYYDPLACNPMGE